VEQYLHFPNTPSWRGTQLKHRDTFTFTFTVYVQNSWSSLHSLESRKHLDLKRVERCTRRMKQEKDKRIFRPRFCDVTFLIA